MFNLQRKMLLTGAYSGICPGGAQHPLGPENPLKSIDFTSPGGLSPHSPPLNTPLTKDETSETILRKLIANYFTSTSANLNVFCLQLYLKGWNIKSNFQMLIISED